MQNLAHPAVDKDLVYSFIFYFTRFEYALKRAGYLMNDTAAKPDWNKFGKELAGKFQIENNPELKGAIEYIMEKPPNRQIVNGNRLDWKEITFVPNASQEERLLQAARAVRNNLFHGGKFPMGDIKEPSRDNDLLKASIEILKEALKHNENVAPHFWM